MPIWLWMFWNRKVAMQSVEISPELAPLLSGDPFAKAFAVEGRVFRNVKNRKTVRFLWNGKPYFIKMHRGIAQQRWLPP